MLESLINKGLPLSNFKIQKTALLSDNGSLATAKYKAARAFSVQSSSLFGTL
jgi:hypothetical protein